MADSRGMQDLFNEKIDTMAKGFGEFTYNFKELCQVTPLNGDMITYFTKTAGTLTPTSPSSLYAAPGAEFETLELTYTKNTAYKNKWGVTGFMDQEDLDDSVLDLFAPTIRDLTEAVVKARDAHIWDVISESQSPVNIQTFATTSIGGDQWDAASYNADIIKDLSYAKKLILDQGYNPEGAVLLLDSTGYSSLVNWLVSGKGSSIPNFASDKVTSGDVMQIMGLRVRVSLNVTTDYAMVIVPKRAATYAEGKDVSAETFRTSKIGVKVEVDASGVAYLTDPLAVVLITDINT